MSFSESRQSRILQISKRLSEASDVSAIDILHKLKEEFECKSIGILLAKII